MSCLESLKTSTSKVVIVADTGPLLALARIDQCHLLAGVFEHCLVTATVANECLAKPERQDALRIQQALTTGVLHAVPDPKSRHALHMLDAGEQTAIEFALSQSCPLLIDEKRGRAAAKALGAQVIGSIGVLLLAKRQTLLREIKPLLLALADQYYFSESLIKHALEIADE